MRFTAGAGLEAPQAERHSSSTGVTTGGAVVVDGGAAAGDDGTGGAGDSPGGSDGDPGIGRRTGGDGGQPQGPGHLQQPTAGDRVRALTERWRFPMPDDCVVGGGPSRSWSSPSLFRHRAYAAQVQEFTPSLPPELDNVPSAEGPLPTPADLTGRPYALPIDLLGEVRPDLPPTGGIRKLYVCSLELVNRLCGETRFVRT